MRVGGWVRVCPSVGMHWPDCVAPSRFVAMRCIASLSCAGVLAPPTADSRRLNLRPSLLQVFLNEVAPRPHNSGHFTIEACCVSQYEQHMRAVIGLPLGDPSMKVGAAAMFNILGEADVSACVQARVCVSACVYVEQPGGGSLCPSAPCSACATVILWRKLLPLPAFSALAISGRRGHVPCPAAHGQGHADTRCIRALVREGR